MSVRAKKHLGQHFLKDEQIAQKIADSLTGKGYEHVLEIAPGMGVLTKYLLKNLQSESLFLAIKVFLLFNFLRCKRKKRVFFPGQPNFGV